MRIKNITSESGNDFSADVECEHCGNVAKLTSGYHDNHYHTRTIRADGCLWGCNNSKRAPGYWAPNGYKMAQIGECGHKVVLPQMIWVVDTSSRECHSPVRQDDPACEGCLK